MVLLFLFTCSLSRELAHLYTLSRELAQRSRDRTVGRVSDPTKDPTKDQIRLSRELAQRSREDTVRRVSDPTKDQYAQLAISRVVLYNSQ